jgi:outer membrane protein assembly factor BamB
VSGAKLFARVGAALTAVKSNPALLRQPGMIVGLDLAAEGRLLPGFPLEVEDRRWAFEGSPVCDGDNLYVAMRRTDEGSPQSACYVACFDAMTGARRWRRMLCESSTVSQANTDEISHILLTLSEGSLYCNTNLGVVAALAPDDGSLRWVVEYPRCSFPATDLESDHLHFFRDLNPCVVHQGVVLAAPTDSDHILAIDAMTGQTLWQTPHPRADDVMHLLGVGHGNLIASGDYLYWFDVATGRQVGQFPQQRSESPGAARADPPGFGRGVLAGDYVYWPTRESIYVFEQRTRRVDRGWEPIGVREIELTHRGATGGNLVIAGGVLLIAAGDRLVAFGEAGGNVVAGDD